ncbi:MAG: hypothetical protein J2P49_09725 [Methylocapsa sp.]|nr:hypothetical protein [Methylocapsa sp.]
MTRKRNREEVVNTQLAILISKLGLTADAETYILRYRAGRVCGLGERAFARDRANQADEPCHRGRGAPFTDAVITGGVLAREALALFQQ